MNTTLLPTFTFPDVTMQDADWVIELAQEVYGRPLDHQGCRDWMADAMTGHQSIFMRRGRYSVGMAVAQRSFHDPSSLQVHMLYLFARRNPHMEGYKMLLSMAEWGRSLGASSFHFGSSSDRDLSPLARRMVKLGAVPDLPTWTLALNP